MVLACLFDAPRLAISTAFLADDERVNWKSISDAATRVVKAKKAKGDVSELEKQIGDVGTQG